MGGKTDLRNAVFESCENEFKTRKKTFPPSFFAFFATVSKKFVIFANLFTSNIDKTKK